MGLLNKIFKRKQEEQIEETKVEKVVDARNTPIKDMPLTEMPIRHEQTVFQKYPEGLPLTILEYIDYSKFGAMLKQERFLPPSYDRKPIKVEIDQVLDQPRVILTFKSKTSDSEREVSIYGYSVASSAKSEHSITILEVKNGMSEVWCDFAENVMWAWDRGYNYALVGPEKNIETYRKLKVDKGTITRLKEIESECKNYCNLK